MDLEYIYSNTFPFWIQYTFDLLSFQRTEEGEQEKNGTEIYIYLDVCMLSTVLFQVSLNHLADVNKEGAFESQPKSGKLYEWRCAPTISTG